MNKKLLLLNLLTVPLIITACGNGETQHSSNKNDATSSSILANSSENQSNPAVSRNALKVDFSGFKKVYEVGEQLDLSNLVVMYDDAINGVKTVLSPNEYKVSGFDSSNPGFSYLQISYNGLVATVQTTIKGYAYKFLNDKYCYYFDESFVKEDFRLYKYDSLGETEIKDFVVDLPVLDAPGVTTLTITHSDFEFKETVYRVERPKIQPLIFHDDYDNETLILYVHTIKETYMPDGNRVAQSFGTYALQSNGYVHLFDFKYSLDQNYRSSFVSPLGHDIQSDDSLKVTIGDHFYIAHASEWHHMVIGW